MTSHAMLAVSSQHNPNALSKQQSFALVKIFLNASLACICHTRELIDWQSDCFRKRYIDDIALDVDDIYHTFCSLNSVPAGNSQEIRTLVRGCNRKADAILDMIENGVFDVIETAYLDVLQIFITTGTGHSKAIQETYTYSFTYLDNAVTSVELKEQQQFLSLVDAQRSFKAAIRSLLRSIKDLPDLPGGCSLGMSMAYNDNCPIKYEPIGFIDPRDHQVAAEDWSRLWNQSGEVISTFEAAHHTISISTRSSAFGYQTASQWQDTVVSKQLQNLQKTSSGRQPGLVSTLPLPISPQRPVPLRQFSTPEVISSSRLTRSASQKSHNGRTALGKPGQLPSADHAVAKLALNPLQGLTIQSKNRRKRNIIPEKMAKAIIHAYAVDFEAEDGQTIFDSVQLDRGFIYRIDRAENVHCECGNEEHSDTMLFCHLCNSWQHSVCYGTSLLRPGSVPDQHLCYSCLLLPEHEIELRDMVENVHMRLALMYISELESDSFKPGGKFSSAVFGPKDNSLMQRKLVERLVGESLVTECDGGSLRVLKVDEATVSRLQTDYLDPFTNIGHLFHMAQSKGETQGGIQEHLDKYARGRDYKLGHGVDESKVLNSFGEEVVWWSFSDDLRGAKRRSTTNSQDEPSPRRRKISISRAFIALDRSTPLDEDDDFRRDAVNSSHHHHAHASSTVTDT